MIWILNELYVSHHQTDKPGLKTWLFLWKIRVYNRTACSLAFPGTNINEALLRAIFILNEANNLGMLDPNSVSLIILVSDGDPTVGKHPFRF